MTSEREEVKIRRYDACEMDYIAERESGDYVKYADHMTALTTAERERDEARRELEALKIDHADALDAYRQMYESERHRAERAERERDAARDAVRLALTELDWQMEAQSRCGEYGAECPLQDAGKWNSEHMEARVACRRALDTTEPTP